MDHCSRTGITGRDPRANRRGSSGRHVSFGRFVDEIEMVLADGKVVRCSPTENDDLFRATLGGNGAHRFHPEGDRANDRCVVGLHRSAHGEGIPRGRRLPDPGGDRRGLPVLGGLDRLRRHGSQPRPQRGDPRESLRRLEDWRPRGDGKDPSPSTSPVSS